MQQMLASPRGCCLHPGRRGRNVGTPEPAEAAPAETPTRPRAARQVLGSLSKELLAHAPSDQERRSPPGGCRLPAQARPAVRRGAASDKDRKKYFYKFFQDEGRRSTPYRRVKENEMLFSLCFGARCVLDQVHRGCASSSSAARTCGALPRPPRPCTCSSWPAALRSAPAGADGAQLGERELRKLCRLARDGVLGAGRVSLP